MKYNWQQSDWPNFSYSTDELEDALFQYAEQSGKLSGMLKALPDEVEVQTMVDILVTEAIKTSEIEGEYFSRKDVVSSIRNNLGLNQRPEKVKNALAKGVAELMIEVRNDFSAPLSERMLLYWHKLLLQADSTINAGVWRTHADPMQVVSGAMGKERVHFEAPPSALVPTEIRRFIKWFNECGPNGARPLKHAPVRAALAHLYFESIHPFEDGNGRIGRSISEKALAQAAGRPILLSLSQTIEKNKRHYYSNLEMAQRSNKATPWLRYFIETVLEAQQSAERLIEFTLHKTAFFDQFKTKLNSRQLKVVKRMLNEGPEGFEGGMNTRKYISICKTSKATATRDLQELLALGVLRVLGGGRSTHYELKLP